MTLRRLDLSYNGVAASEATVLANGVMRNAVLRDLRLDGMNSHSLAGWLAW